MAVAERYIQPLQVGELAQQDPQALSSLKAEILKEIHEVPHTSEETTKLTAFLRNIEQAFGILLSEDGEF